MINSPEGSCKGWGQKPDLILPHFIGTPSPPMAEKDIGRAEFSNQDQLYFYVS